VVVVVVNVPVLQVAVLVVVAVDVLALALALSSSRCLLFFGCDSKDMSPADDVARCIDTERWLEPKVLVWCVWLMRLWTLLERCKSVLMPKLVKIVKTCNFL
jgi:hypothetical protein